MTTLARERGQALIMVALMVVVLFGFVALALDLGNVYGGRRRMQNAADAGALAGARDLCFGSGDRATAKAIAEDYATDYNGAHGAIAAIPSDGYTVTVIATQTLDTFVAGVIGIQTAEVRAEAAALCGTAVRAGGLWPIGFSYDTYSNSIPCNQEFIVFAENDDVDCAGDDGCQCVDLSAQPPITETTETCEEKCDCEAIGPHIGPGSRGWLRLFEPEEGYPDKNCANEGAKALACWLEHGHPGPVQVGDCVAGKPGLSASQNVDTAVNSRAGDVVNVVLWDRPCNQDGDPEALGGAPASDEKVYHVAGFACVKVIEWVDKFWIPECGSSNKNPQNNNEACMKFIHVVRVEKICDTPADNDLYDQFCRTHAGANAGALPDDMEIRAANLVR